MPITYCYLHRSPSSQTSAHGLDLAQVRKGLVCKIRALSFQNSCAHWQRTAHCVVRQVSQLRIPWWQDHANRLRLDIGRIAARYEESTAKVSSSVRGRFRDDV